MKITNHNISHIKNMIINILENKEKKIRKNIEKEKNPYKRTEQRLFLQIAIKCIAESKL